MKVFRGFLIKDKENAFLNQSSTVLDLFSCQAAVDLMHFVGYLFEHRQLSVEEINHLSRNLAIFFTLFKHTAYYKLRRLNILDM